MMCIAISRTIDDDYFFLRLYTFRWSQKQSHFWNSNFDNITTPKWTTLYLLHISVVCSKFNGPARLLSNSMANEN